MTRQINAVLTICILAAGMSLAMAQSGSAISFAVGFPFKIGDVDCAPGQYRLVYEGKGARHLVVYNLTNNRSHFVRFTTRLSEREDSGVVFDRIGDSRFLSEVYMNGSDGFQLSVTSAAHSHENQTVEPSANQR